MWFKYCSNIFLMMSIYDSPLGIFQKIFLILYMCVCLWVCSHMYRCPGSPEEGDSRFLELELQEVVSQPTWVLCRAILAVKCQAD